MTWSEVLNFGVIPQVPAVKKWTKNVNKMTTNIKKTIQYDYQTKKNPKDDTPNIKIEDHDTFLINMIPHTSSSPYTYCC